MAWDTVIGQERAVTALRTAVGGGRVAQAYLFHGPEGSGKRAAALALARAVLCERRGTAGAPADDACGECPACLRVRHMTHPDLRFLFPRPKEADASDVGARLALLADSPYTVIDYRRRPSLDGRRTQNKQSIYSIDMINVDLRRALSLHPVEGRATVAVLCDAEAMNDAAANSFLRLLEEPRPHVTLVLTTERPDKLLPTVLSRCQRVRFEPLGPEEIEAALVSREAIAPARAAVAARLADGSYTRARALAEGDDVQELRDRAVDFTRAALELRPSEMPAIVEATAALGREPLKGFLAQLLSWVRDLVLARTLGREAPVVNVDRAESLREVLERAPRARFDLVARHVEDAADMLERNVHSGLLVSTLAFSLHDALAGRPRERLSAPLTG
jgi:DNA polymerase-3 subunit delta'